MAKKVISRNRNDYSPAVHAMLEAAAELFENGDLDRVWNEYFDSLENEDWDKEQVIEPKKSRVHLSVVSHAKS